MPEKYKMKHAIVPETGKPVAKKMAVKWKVISAVAGSLAVLALLFLGYLYIPLMPDFIGRGINFLFKSPDSPAGQQEEESSPVETEESDEEIEQEPIPEEEPEDVIEEEEKEAEEEEVTELATAPTIILRIYEGPLYSQSDDICYYRVLAEVSGEPAPEVIFNKDDSLGSLGQRKAQVNLTRENPSFTLNSTAKNSAGSVSDSVTLSWDCNRAPDIKGISLSSDTLYVNEQCEVSVEAVDLDGDVLSYQWSADGGSLEGEEGNPAKWNTPDTPGDYILTVNVMDALGNESDTSVTIYIGEEITDPDQVNTNLPRKEGEGGYIEYGGATYSGGNLYAGDSENNKPCSGFISFDISGIQNMTIGSASLTLSGAVVSGDPLVFFNTLWINVLDWGAEPIVQDDFNLTGIAVASYDSPNLVCNVSKLKEELQKAVNAGKPRFQIRIHFSGGYSDDDNTGDGWGYAQNNITLNVTVDQ